MKILRVLVMVCLAVPATARAEESAKEHFSRGMISFNLQDWPNALKELKAAYAADPQPNTLFTIGQAQRLSGDCPAAILTYRSFLRTATANQRAAAEGLIRQCEGKIESARIEADKERQRQQLEAEKEREKAKDTASVVAAPPVAVEKPAPLNTAWYADPLGDVLAIGALAVVGAGAACVVRGNAAVARSNSTTQFAEYQRELTSGQPLQIAGVAMISAGTALFIGAVARYLVVSTRHAEPPAALGLIVTEQGAAVSVSGHF